MTVPRARRVAVIGGGWAGLAAAVEATSLGHEVTLFEMASTLGGRARSFEASGLQLDNGQHILIGAYVETLALLRRIGLDVESALLRTPLRLVDIKGRGLKLSAGNPALAFVWAVLRRRGWRRRERLALLGAALSWALKRFRCDAALTVAELTHKLPQALRRDLIDPLCVAALNTPADKASATVFLRVLRDALFSAPGSADLLLPRVPLGSLLPQAAQRWLNGAGATVETGKRVMRLEQDGSTWRVDKTAFDDVVLACSAVEAARLARPFNAGWAHAAAALRYEPIVTVYLRGIGVGLREPMLALASDDESNPAQFVFDLGRLRGESGLLAFVVSGAATWLERGTDAIEAAVMAQARSLPKVGAKTRLSHLRTLIERRATFLCTPQLERPPAAIAAGLQAAGDHVDGPYPATLEAAVRSGLAAARALHSTRSDTVS